MLSTISLRMSITALPATPTLSRSSLHSWSAREMIFWVMNYTPQGEFFTIILEII
jgi:hypothetical protein